MCFPAAIVCVVLYISGIALCFGIVPGTVWTIYGIDFLDSPPKCQDDIATPDLGLWLVVEGASLFCMNLFVFGCTCLSCMFFLCNCRNIVKTIVYLLDGVIFLYGLFNVSWLVVGCIRLLETNCGTDDTIFNVTVAAIILGFVGVGFSFGTVKYLKDFKKKSVESPQMNNWTGQC